LAKRTVKKPIKKKIVKEQTKKKKSSSKTVDKKAAKKKVKITTKGPWGAFPGNKNASKWTEKRALVLANSLLSWMEEDEKNIYWEEFFLLVRKNYDRQKVKYLSDQYPSFSTLVKKAKGIQEIKLIKWANLGKLNPAITIFCLKNNHGYRDKQDITTDGYRIDSNIKVEILKDKTKK